MPGGSDEIITIDACTEYRVDEKTGSFEVVTMDDRKSNGEGASWKDTSGFRLRRPTRLAARVRDGV